MVNINNAFKYQTSGKNDSREGRKLFFILTSIVLVILFWASVNFSNASFSDIYTSTQQNELLFLSNVSTQLALMLGFVLLIAIYDRFSHLFDFARIGNTQQIFNGILVGGGLAVLGIVVQVFGLKAISITETIPLLSWFFVAVAVPFVEESVFRGAMGTTLFKWTNNFWVANGIQAVVFALFHASVDPTGANFLGHVAFGLVATILNNITGSIFGGTSLHIINNVFLV